jgi:hypothetical protein
MAMLVRVVALGVMVAAVACGEPDGPYVPRYCDDTFRLDRAGLWISSLDGTLEISQAEESEPDLCDHSIAECDPGWILQIEPARQKPGVHTWSNGGESWVGCWVCEGDWGGEGTESSAGGAWLAWEKSVTLEITAIDHEHVAGCILEEPDDPTWGRECGRDAVRFDVPCAVDGA